MGVGPGNIGAGEFLEGPVLFVLRAFLDPLNEGLFLRDGETVSGIEWWHVVVLIFGKDAGDEL